MVPLDQKWTIVEAVRLACTLEASAPKVGNVHPGARFTDMHYGHFLASAMAVAPLFDRAGQCSVGQLVFDCVQATKRQVGCNTNLGTLLLLVPLAKAAAQIDCSDSSSILDPLKQRATDVLDQLTPEDSRYVYAAIRLAQPGGLGSEQQHDVLGPAPEELKEAMRQVAHWDAVARQYVTGFEDIFQRLLPWLEAELPITQDPLQSIVRLQLRWLAWEPDGLIIRKLGLDAAQEVQRRAQQVWNSLHQRTADRNPGQLTFLDGKHMSEAERIALDDLDHYLRQDGNRRNPGTTADLIAATLFCKLIGCRLR
jgi:triphosphoribosyl-dephospho-CoA synthase